MLDHHKSYAQSFACTICIIILKAVIVGPLDNVPELFEASFIVGSLNNVPPPFSIVHAYYTKIRHASDHST